MFDTSLLAMDYPVNPNPNNYNVDPIIDQTFPTAEFQLSDYLMLDGNEDCFGDDSSSQSTMLSSEQLASATSLTAHSIGAGATSRNANNNRWRKGVRNDNTEVGHKVAFRTKSELEVMDDGFKWRKYGKKSVKNSPNPRNYYKCSNGGCNVKKRVERDRDDSRYVITTYDGIHNHESPCVLYYNHNHNHYYNHPMATNSWNNLQSSSPHSSTSS